MRSFLSRRGLISTFHLVRPASSALCHFPSCARSKHPVSRYDSPLHYVLFILVILLATLSLHQALLPSSHYSHNFPFSMSQSPPPPPPLEFPVIDVWKDSQVYQIRYVIHQPWSWVMDRVKTASMQALSEASSLPLALQQAATQESVTSTPRQRRQRSSTRGRPKHQLPAVLRMEVVDPATNQVVVAWHCTSSAFDGLEDKDALVRTIQRCRVEELQLSPPSVLINWDVSLEECRNVIGGTLPTIASNEEDLPFAVLKEPMGSQGKGIYFVRSVDEIHAIIDEHHQRAREEPEVLEDLIAAKGRIPSWGTSRYANNMRHGLIVSLVQLQHLTVFCYSICVLLFLEWRSLAGGGDPVSVGAPRTQISHSYLRGTCGTTRER